jgi:hypothetical protein
MLKYSFILLLFAVSNSFGQCKTFIIGVKGDTLNCTDNAGLKQGKWVLHTPDLRGEKGYEEEGVFEDSKREGTWRKYSLQGDVLAVESYKYGYKNGKSQYFGMAGLIREETWKAVNPEYPYDTVDVYDLNDPNKIQKRIVKVEGSSYRHGTWTYYDPSNGAIYKTEEYVLDKLQTPLNKQLLSQKMAGKDSTTTKKIEKPAAVAAYEKKYSGKKKVKTRDGSTGY